MKHVLTSQNRWGLRAPRGLGLGILLILVFSIMAPLAQAAAPRPVQTFYIPLPEEQVRAPLYTISTATGMTLRTAIGVSVTANGAVIYYDQWENGYELDIANPKIAYNASTNPAGTQIWGDGNPANGAPPNVPSDLLNAGTIIVLENDITLPRNPAQIKYDGRDKLGATRVVAVTRSAWGLQPGTVLTDAVEVYDTTRWGTSFKIPIGQNLSASAQFEYVSLAVMAAENNTRVDIDTNGDGTVDISNVKLNQGESYQVSGGVSSNASVTASRPAQVDVITGDIGSTYESRWFSIPPTEQWGPSYYTPFGTTNTTYPANVWLYNPNATSLTINYETKMGTGSVSVAAAGTYRFLMPALSGAHFWSSGSSFLAVGTMDSSTTGTDQSFDWGYTLVTDAWLTTQLVAGWAPGTDTSVSCTVGTCNGSPVWVTALQPTTLYADYDGNPTTGGLTDPQGNRYDAAFSLGRLESVQIYDPDKNQTGMHVYTLDGVLISGAWGEDPAYARPGNPYLDMGYTIPPLPQASLQKTAALAVDGNGDGLLEPGDTLAYTVTLRNTGATTLFSAIISDTFPANMSYVAGSTTLNGSPVADNISPATSFPVDAGGIEAGPVLVGGTATVNFRAIADAGVYSLVTNTANALIDTGPLTATVSTAVNTGSATACGLTFTNAGGTHVTVYLENGTAYVQVNDNDQNTSASAVETIAAQVQVEATADYEALTLTETGVNTGVFRGSLPTSITTGQGAQDGTLYARGGDTLLASYSDPVYGDACNDTAIVTLPSQTKALYLSEPGQSLDRIDPVATGDTTTAASIALGIASPATIAVDNVSSALNAAAVATIAVDNSASAVNTAAAAIAVDNTSESTLNNYASASFPHTTGTGSNRLMLIGVSCQQPGASITALTYAGVSLTKVGNLSNSSQSRIEIWRLIAPASGTNTVLLQNSQSDNCVIGVMTFTGVHQTTPLGTFASAQGSSTSASVTASSATGELVFAAVAFNNGDTDLTPGSGQTEYWDNTVNSSIAGAGGTKAGASSVTMSWTSTSASWTIGAVPIKPAGAGGSITGVTISNFTTGSGSNRLMLVGVSFRRDGPATQVSSVTYGAQSLTFVGGQSDTGLQVRMEIWRLVAPNSGTANVVVTLNGTTQGIAAGAVTFTGADQTTPLGAFASAQGNSATPSVSVSSASGELVFDTVAFKDGLALNPGAGQTERWDVADGDSKIRGASSTEAGAASVNMSWSEPGSNAKEWAIGAVPIKPAGFATATAGVTISSFTTGSGSNRLMLVGVSIDLNSSSAAVSSVAYGSQALTLVGSATNTNNERMELWRLVNPTSGTANITVTMNGQAHNGVIAGVTTFTGVDQTTPLGTFASNTGTSTAPSVNVTSASGELVFAVAAAGQATTFSAVGAGQTSRWNATDSADIAGAASTEAGAATVTMSWTSSSVPWAIGGVPLKPAPGAITTTGMAVWYSGSGSATRYNPWNGITFTVSSNTASLGTITQGLQGAAAPTRNEKVVLGIDAFGALVGEVWNGSAWTLIPSGALGSPGFTHQWAYDAAYEQQSGDALIAFADGNNLKYATWNGSSWSSATTVSDYAALSGGNTPKRVALAARPGSNELAMVVTENLGKTMAWIWNGSSWGSGTVLQSGTGVPNTSSAVAYESLSGNIMATYSKGFGQTAVYYKVWNGSAWSAEASTAAPSGYTTNFNFSALASDPNSDRIVLGVTLASGTAKTWMNVWDGSSWGTSVTGSTTAGSVNYPSVDVAFESTSGEALAVFNDASLPNIYYKFWKPATGWLAVPGLGLNIGATANIITLSPDPNADRIMVAAQNANDDLNYTVWPGDAPFDPAIVLETSTGGTSGNSQPFLFLWDEHLGGSSGGGVTSTDFTQAQPMASDFIMPAGGTITVTNYISITAGAAAPTTGMATWAPAAATKYAGWGGTAFDSAGTGANNGNRWRIMQGAAAPARNEKIVVGIENTSGTVSGQLWNGSAWSAISIGGATDFGLASESFWWGADVAYEQLSGNALLVYDDNPNLKYSVWNGSSWSAETTITPPLSGEPKQIVLASKPGSDEIVAVVGATSGTYALVWNGSAWGNSVTLYSSSKTDFTDVAVAYEQQSGHALVVYEANTGDGNTQYRTWNGSTWSAEATISAPGGVSSYAKWATLAADPTSDRIVLGVLTSGGSSARTWLSVWDGAAWGTSFQAASSSGGGYAGLYPGVAVAFESDSGQVLAAYSTTSNNVLYRTWTGGAWSSEQTGTDLGAIPNSKLLYADPGSDQIMLAVQDEGQDLNYVLWNGSSWQTTTELETTSGETKNQPFVFIWSEHESPPVGSLPASPAITATLKYNGVTFATLTGPTATDLGGGVYRLDWSAVLGSNTTVATGEAVNLTVSSGITQTFQVLYDSSSYPSKVELPTTTVIDLTALQVYDAAYPNGAEVAAPYPGQTVYVRATASDPFGVSDIVSATLNVAGTMVVVTDTAVVATTATSKTYEYAWRTPSHEGACPVTATAHEGYEGILDNASLALECRFLDTGTPSTTEFTTGNNGPHTTRYNTDQQVCVRTTDVDQNLNPAVAETIMDTIVSLGGGDSEVVTLTETGVDTGIFSACINASSTVVGTPNNGALYAPSGDTLRVTYVDPTDANDTSSDVALVAISGASGPGIAVFKWLALPLDGIAVVGEVVRFDVTVINGGDTDLATVTVTDTFPSGCLAFVSASIAPGSVTTPTLVWNDIGPLAAGAGKDISLYFTASAACNPATNQVTVSGVTGGGVVVTDGPVTASVITTDPRLTVVKTLLTPPGGTATVGDPVSFRITIQNTGSTGISYLPLADNYSGYCLEFLSASPAPGGAGGGVALWSNLGALGVGASTEVVVNFLARGACNPAVNSAIVNSALDVNGDQAPPAQGNADLVIVAQPPAAQLVKTLASPATGLAYLGDPVTYTVRITNTGPNVFTQMVITDTWASSCMTLTAWGAYTPTQLSLGQVAWNSLVPPEPPLWPGESLTLTLGFQTTAVTTTCTNTATLTGVDEFEQPFGPLTSQASVRVLPAASTVYGHIFVDTNGNGSQGAGEPALANVSVVITDSVGFTRTVTTDASGNYTATVPAGSTTANIVEATLPAGYVQTAGSDPSTVNVSAGSATNIGADGYQPRGSLAGRVFHDLDEDGVWDSGEPDLAGVTVNLTGAGPDGLLGTADDVSYGGQVTAGNGAYSFGNLPPGQYRADVAEATLPAGYGSATGPEPLDVGLAASQALTGVDFGYRMLPTVSISKRLVTPADRTVLLTGEQVDFQIVITNTGTTSIVYLPQLDLFDSACLAYSGKTASPTESDSGTPGQLSWFNLAASFGRNLAPGQSFTTTLPFGVVGVSPNGFNRAVVSNGRDTAGQLVPTAEDTVSFTCVNPARIGDTVYTDINGNGTQDGGEPGLGGVGVRLAQPDGSVITATTTITGFYAFTMLPPGAYTVTVDGATVPAGYALTTGNDPLVMNLGGGQNYDTADFGYRPLPVTIGDRVCVDANSNGLCDDSDYGVGNIPVRITGVDLFGASVDITATTSITGFYRVDTLTPGVYTVTAPGPVYYGYLLNSTSPLTTSLPTGGDQDLTRDFIYTLPTAVQVNAPSAVIRPGEVRLSWEARLYGLAPPQFHVWRSAGGDNWKRLTAAPLAPTVSNAETATYSFSDTAIQRGASYLYRLENEAGDLFGPWSVSVPATDGTRRYLPLVGR